MKVLVTGASGNVGRYVVQHLLNLGETVVAAGTDPEKLKAIFGDAVEAVTLDFEKSETFTQALAGVDRIFLMRPPHLGNPQALYPFIDAAKRQPIRLISFLSLMGVEKNPFPPHKKIEKYIERSGLPYAHIRPGFFMQNLLGVHVHEIKMRNEIFVPAGKSKTSFIDADDIGQAVAKVLSQPVLHQGKAYTLTGSEALDYCQIADLLSEVTGRRITYANPGLLKYRRDYIHNRRLESAYVNITVALYVMTRLGTAQAVTNDFYSLTGQQPKSFMAFAEANKNAFELLK